MTRSPFCGTRPASQVSLADHGPDWAERTSALRAGAKVSWTGPPHAPPPPPFDQPGSMGPMTVALWQEPLVYTLPASGGSSSFDRSLSSGDDGWFSKGTLTVTPGANG